MTFRLFKSRNGNTMAEHIKNKCTQQTIRIENTSYNIPNQGLVTDYDDTYTISPHSNSNIKYSTGDYTLLRKYKTIYNEEKLDAERRPIRYFNGEINSSMFLEQTHNPSSNIPNCDNKYKDYIFNQTMNNNNPDRILCEESVIRELPNTDWETFTIVH